MKYLFSILVLLCLAVYSCAPDDDLNTSSDVMLSFSTDTLRFDTVFTSLGSATRSIKLYNNEKQPVEVSKIYFEEGASTRFRMNVDGLPGAAENVKIPANDSIYIFMEVTIDPNDINSPFVVEEKLMIETNGNRQSVVLEAWGQNAIYVPNQFANGGTAVLSCNGGEVLWDDEKPYVIFGSLLIDECALRIAEGTNIYVHGGLESFQAVVEGDTVRQFYNDGRIFTTETGSLRIEGTFDNPVVIQGDRLEEPFQEISGQWFGIVLSAQSTGNVFDYVTIKNAVIGVAVDSLAELTTSYSSYHNTTSAGLYAINATVNARNCLFYNNAGGGVALLEGGEYNFDNCTMASYGVDADALSFSDALCFGSPIPCSEFYSDDLTARFNNCIISGSRPDEVAPFHLDVDNTTFDYEFNNCVIKLDEVLTEGGHTDFLDFCNDCIIIENSDNLFVDENEGDYHLDTLSVAEEKALPISDLLFDLDNVMRDGDMPDVGCYEYVDE
ncbi:MAG: right-handed parallel beta-helix repeat-containing protein [Saprospiraceae bacterium]